jgi:hypothetical protein
MISLAGMKIFKDIAIKPSVHPAPPDFSFICNSKFNFSWQVNNTEKLPLYCSSIINGIQCIKELRLWESGKEGTTRD